MPSLRQTVRLLLLFGAICIAQGVDSISVGGFADLTIVQRVGVVGSLRCSGSAPIGVRALEAQVTAEDGTTAIGSWTTIATPDANGAWNGTISGVPQGGWYRVRIRPVGTPAAAPALSDARFGVGIVVLCLGQSNMVRFFDASASPAPSDARTRLQGYHGVTLPAGTQVDRGAGPVVGNGAIRFANRLQQELQIPVLLLDYAVEGKSLAAWTTLTDPIWTTMVAGVAAAGGDFEMVLWHQGANDAFNGVSEAWHRSLLDRLYANLKALVPARTTLPFVCAVQNRGDYRPKPATADDGYDHVRRAQWLWSTSTPGVVPGGSTIDMALIDVGHWPTLAYELMADRLGQSALSVLAPTRFTRHAGGATLDAAMHSGRRVLVTVRHAGGRAIHGRTADTGIEGFVVDRGAGTATIAVTSAEVIGPDTVELTLASDPGTGIRVRYLVGMNPFPTREPGNCLYDDLAYVGGRVGLPVNAESVGIVALEPLRRVRIDLGQTANPSGEGWNNLVWPAKTLAELAAVDGGSTPFALSVSDAFLGANSSGATTAVDDLPVSATIDGYYGGENWAGANEPTAGLRVSGLTTSKRYVLSCFGSRTSVTDSRQTQYTLTGGAAVTASVTRLLECANNSSAIAMLPPLAPTAAGTLDLDLRKGPANTNGNGFYYLGALLIDEFAGAEAPPDPATARRWLIDLGGRSSAAPWNNLTWPGTDRLALRDDTGAETPIGIAVTDPFLSWLSLGYDAQAGEIPATAINDAFMGGVNFLDKNDPTAALRLTGLDPNAAYRISVGGSRMGTSDNREARFTLSADGSATPPLVRLLQTGNNTGTLAVFDPLRPSSAGTLDLAVEKGPANNNSNGFYYLGVIIVEQIPVSQPPPEPPPATGRRLLIDLGGRLSPAPWNNLTWPGTDRLALRDDTGTDTPIGVAVSDPFLNWLSLGHDAQVDEIPATAINDAFMGGVNFLDKNEPTAALRLTGLDPTATYTISVGGSRIGTNDNREAKFTLSASGSGTPPLIRLLQTGNNTGALAVFDPLQPSSAGTLDLSVEKGPANTSANGFYYLGLIIIQEVPAQPAGNG